MDKSYSIKTGPSCPKKTESPVIQQYAGLDIVKELIEICHLSKWQDVLDIGCGIRATSYLLAKFGCRVVGVDISPGMIDWARKKARDEGLDNMVEFKVTDAEKLPFDDATFDIVISQFVLAFVNDRQRALSEYVRVVRPGGFVCLNESSWLKTPDQPYLITDFHTTEETVQLLSMSNCEELLSGAGLKDITVRTYRFSNRNELANNSRPGFYRRFLELFPSVFNKSPTYRGWEQKKQSPKSVAEYYGYGLYIGRK